MRFKSKLRSWVRLFLIFMGFYILSCRTGKEEVPGNLLPPERMQEILWDMIRADLYVRDYIVDSLKMDRNIAFYKEIFQVHKTSQEQFRESFKYYRAHPKEMRAMLDSLEKRSKVQVPKPVQPVDTIRKLPVFRSRDTIRVQ